MPEPNEKGGAARKVREGGAVECVAAASYPQEVRDSREHTRGFRSRVRATVSARHFGVSRTQVAAVTRLLTFRLNTQHLTSPRNTPFVS